MKTLAETLWQALGWIFLVIGTLGLFVPLLQGIPLIVVGVLLISRYNPKLRDNLIALLKKAVAKYSGLSKLTEKLKKVCCEFTGRGED